jgi:hypothetical protein
MLRDERLHLGLERRGKHPARALARNLGQGIVHRARLAQRDDAGIFFDGVSLPSEVLAGFITRLDTSPPQIASPSFGHSSQNCGPVHLLSPHHP